VEETLASFIVEFWKFV